MKDPAQQPSPHSPNMAARFTHHPILATLCLVSCVPVFWFFLQTQTNFAKLAILGIELWLLTIVYRVTLHPLAKYPGPWYAVCAEFYNLFSCLCGERHLHFKIWHDTYGPVVRYAPNRLSFCTAEAVQAIYGVRANTQKSQVYNGFNIPFEASATLTCIDRGEHAFKRRILKQALEPSRLGDFENSILENTRVLTGTVLGGVKEENWSHVVDLSETIQYLFTDMMGETIFSKKLEVQTSKTNRFIPELLPTATAGIHAAGHVVLTLKLQLHRFLFPGMMRGVFRFIDLSRQQCIDRIRDSATIPHHDVFSSLIDEKARQERQETELKSHKPSKKQYSLTLKDLTAEAGILMVAGADTSATCTVSTLFYLLHYPDMLAKVRTELDSVFPPDAPGGIENITPSTVAKCKYLYACIDEAMRLSPPVSGLLPREVLPGGITIADRWVIPAGVDVGVPAYAIHRDERYWSAPHTFMPERWLDSSDKTQNEKPDSKDVFMPFGVGRTICVGKAIAYQEMGVVLARMLWAYDFQVVSKEARGWRKLYWDYVSERQEWGRTQENEFQMLDVFTSYHEGPLVQLRKRSGRDLQ
ncbi:cytochrome P450 [Periconia macrospinosa]|uniref:Cytochrome P450 n=1 Tax=Periconia macrospinosa TaxID=97972 RepID=A0A2V1DRD9_9PLEO|nr:cytochrome P450 [Periconia macrospinosa]